MGHWCHSYLTFVAVLFLALACSDKDLTSRQVALNSIAYHDPAGTWSTFQKRLHFNTDVAEQPDVRTDVDLDNQNGYFRYMQPANGTDMGILRDSCFRLDEKELNCDAIKRTRDYWSYLWGLPMKWLDPGVQIDTSLAVEDFNGYACYKIKIQYTKDVWYFYIDQENYALRGEVFYVDEDEIRGEKLIRSGEVNVDGIFLPKSRRWENTHDGIYLATDTLVGFEGL